jgi:tetratricopeptide (TPR) repeat protein
LLALGYRLFQKAEKDGMHDFTFYNSFGIAAANIGKFDEAHQWYKTALNFDGEHAWALLNDGAVYEKQGDLVAAQRTYEKSLDGGFRVCELDQKIWKDIDSWDLAKLGVMGDRMRAVLPEGAFDRLMQMRTPTKVQCSVIAAVGGLLNTLGQQGNPKEFARVYRNYLEDPTLPFGYPDVYRGVFGVFKFWQCNGIDVEVPSVPPAISGYFPLADGRFICDGSP